MRGVRIILGGYEHAVLELDAVAVEPIAGITASEQAVAQLAIAGLSNAEIAARRGTAVRTVVNQMASIYRKLGIGSRLELAALGRRKPDK